MPTRFSSSMVCTYSNICPTCCDKAGNSFSVISIFAREAIFLRSVFEIMAKSRGSWIVDRGSWIVDRGYNDCHPSVPQTGSVLWLKCWDPCFLKFDSRSTIHDPRSTIHENLPLSSHLKQVMVVFIYIRKPLLFNHKYF